MAKEKKSGGARDKAGRKSFFELYGENETRVTLLVPKSKKIQFKKEARQILDSYKIKT